MYQSVVEYSVVYSVVYSVERIGAPGAGWGSWHNLLNYKQNQNHSSTVIAGVTVGVVYSVVTNLLAAGPFVNYTV